MKLSFYPRPGMMCWDPERPPRFSGGHPAGYVGRSLVRAQVNGDGNVTKAGYYRANDEPYEAFAASKSGRRLAKLCKRGELWAADRVTASFCGVEFVELQQGSDGEWRPKPSGKTKKDD